MGRSMGIMLAMAGLLAGCGNQQAAPQAAPPPPARPADKAAAKPPPKPVARPALPAPGSGRQPAMRTPERPASTGSERTPGTLTLDGPGGRPVAGTLLGRTERAVRALFGEPQLAVREGPGLKLQFAGGQCVVDIYFYPADKGNEMLVRHIDARDRAGADADRDACVAALGKRSGR